MELPWDWLLSGPPCSEQGSGQADLGKERTLQPALLLKEGHLAFALPFVTLIFLFKSLHVHLESRMITPVENRQPATPSPG